MCDLFVLLQKKYYKYNQNISDDTDSVNDQFEDDRSNLLRIHAALSRSTRHFVWRNFTKTYR